MEIPLNPESELPHQVLRWDIRLGSNRHDAPQSQFAKRVLDQRLAGFERISLTPVVYTYMIRELYLDRMVGIVRIVLESQEIGQVGVDSTPSYEAPIRL